MAPPGLLKCGQKNLSSLCQFDEGFSTCRDEFVLQISVNPRGQFERVFILSIINKAEHHRDI